MITNIELTTEQISILLAIAAGAHPSNVVLVGMPEGTTATITTDLKGATRVHRAIAKATEPSK